MTLSRSHPQLGRDSSKRMRTEWRPAAGEVQPSMKHRRETPGGEMSFRFLTHEMLLKWKERNNFSRISRGTGLHRQTLWCQRKYWVVQKMLMSAPGPSSPMICTISQPIILTIVVFPTFWVFFSHSGNTHAVRGFLVKIGKKKRTG